MNFTFPLQIAGIGFLAFAVSFLSVAFLRRWAERRQILDIPNERSSHARPIPRGGGLAIVSFSLIGLTATWLLSPGRSLRMLLTFLTGAALISVVSWLDDLRPLSNRIRFAAHSVAAILAILGLGYWSIIDIPFVGQSQIGRLGFLITFLWVVGLTNAYNFMDGIDGIAGGQAVVAGLGWAALGSIDGQPLISVLGLLLAMSSLGFLGHNWPPARIFMGDVGSAFLGYTFGILPVIAAQKGPHFVLIGALLVWPFIFDTIFTFVRRLRKGENVLSAHRSHLYQRLVIGGYTHRFVTLLYMGLALAGLILALIWYLRVPGSSAIVGYALPLLCAALWVFVIRKERKIRRSEDGKMGR